MFSQPEESCECTTTHFPLRYIQKKKCREGKPSVSYSPTYNDSSTGPHWSTAGATWLMTLPPVSARRLKPACLSVYGNMLVISEKNKPVINHIWHTPACLPRKQDSISLQISKRPCLGWHIKFVWVGENEAIPVLISQYKIRQPVTVRYVQTCYNL